MRQAHNTQPGQDSAPLLLELQNLADQLVFLEPLETSSHYQRWKDMKTTLETVLSIQKEGTAHPQPVLGSFQESPLGGLAFYRNLLDAVRQEEVTYAEGVYQITGSKLCKLLRAEARSVYD
ncbi:hypothetical protein HZB01_04985 [Candidatus Woesearchaeota archaeon]|nr:hypothetical protein [Candidatus Woesearchaeota archaeon]